MAKKEQDFKKLENGDIEAVQRYEGKSIAVNIKGTDVNIGDALAYQVKQVIRKDAIPSLIEYLEDQRKMVMDRIKAAKDVIEKLSYMNLELFGAELSKLPKDKLGIKKLAPLNQMASDFYMKKEAMDKLVVLEPNIEKFDEQLTFLRKSI